jgi:leucyl-tRNA synthetase
MNYDFSAIEASWKKKWQKNPDGKTRPVGSGKKFYCLDMFPYPSGAGLHVGHWKGYVLSDVYTRMKWLEGYNILHPMGWDAFGLPAENDAIKKGMHPAINTAKNIANFKEQLQDVGALYDWSKEVNTTDPDYYKWTQWIFLQMYKAGLAYEKTMAINWCPSCKTGLANEEVVKGSCERCGELIEQREIPQWMLKITDYAEKLLEGLDRLDWPEKVKMMQRNWIGKSHGARINFIAKNGSGKEINISVFTTRPDTILGATFLVLAPEHDLAEQLTTQEQEKSVAAYQASIAHMTPLARQESTEKTGVFSGSYATNPLTKQQIPIYFASYVLKDYGTGAIMAVPGGDERDLEFAQKFNLPVVELTASEDQKQAITSMIQFLENNKLGTGDVQYKLRDWVFSRQRYWGEPIPLIRCSKCGIVPVPEDQLPIMLPDVEKYEPTGTGESPLAAIDSWVNTTCPSCGGAAKRETNTMPQWAGSCWYFLRYPNPQLKNKPFDQKDMDYWLPVDLYIGGIEHAILHLLYARFYIKVLHDLKFLSFDEPFTHLFNQGMVLKKSEKSGLVEKMSKSKGNVVNPDDMVKLHGSDALRTYMLFMGPPELDCEWQDNGIDGTKRFLIKIWAYFTTVGNILSDKEQEDIVATKRIHKGLKEYQERLIAFKPNTAISAFMELFNDITQQKMRLSKQSAQNILIALSVMAPFMTSELLEKLFDKQLRDCTWPQFDPTLAQDDIIDIAVQICGKTRSMVSITRTADQTTVEAAAKEAVVKWIEGKKIIKTIYVPQRLINFVVA